MNRKIKFRAWLKEEKKMVKVSELRDIDTDIKSDQNVIYFDFEKQEYCNKGFDEVELMLGLKIYDEIIFVEDVVHIYGGEQMFGCYEIDKIKVIRHLEDLITLSNLVCGIEVIGNIYENPELLEEK